MLPDHLIPVLDFFTDMSDLQQARRTLLHGLRQLTDARYMVFMDHAQSVLDAKLCCETVSRLGEDEAARFNADFSAHSAKNPHSGTDTTKLKYAKVLNCYDFIPLAQWRKTAYYKTFLKPYQIESSYYLILGARDVGFKWQLAWFLEEIPSTEPEWRAMLDQLGPYLQKGLERQCLIASLLLGQGSVASASFSGLAFMTDRALSHMSLLGVYGDARAIVGAPGEEGANARRSLLQAVREHARDEWFLWRHGNQDLRVRVKRVSDQGDAILLRLGIEEPGRPVAALGSGFAAKCMQFGLTDREMDVAKGLLQGQSNKEIAYALALSPNTVSKHVSRIFRKLGASSKADAVRLFLL
jgi:DNA-binding CsgD family transcriptional regulator